jgi:hypothetical protein
LRNTRKIQRVCLGITNALRKGLTRGYPSYHRIRCTCTEYGVVVVSRKTACALRSREKLERSEVRYKFGLVALPSCIGELMLQGLLSHAPLGVSQLRRYFHLP